jgi:ribose 5-phosphate isomerase B
MKKMISIGCDHAGYSLKLEIKEQLINWGYEVLDMGCHSEESIDYPDFAHPVAEYVENKIEAKGILICGSGNGINMAANKHQGIRSALCWKVEIAKLAREHNNANIVALPARFISTTDAIKIVEVFLNTPFEGGRHQKRVEKIACV